MYIYIFTVCSTIYNSYVLILLSNVTMAHMVIYRWENSPSWDLIRVLHRAIATIARRWNENWSGD